MKYQLLIDARAEEEAAEAFEYYYEIHSELAYEFYEQLDRVYDKVENNPASCQLVNDYIRRALLAKFPYAVFYRILPENRVLVLTILHTSRNPKSWPE